MPSERLQTVVAVKQVPLVLPDLPVDGIIETKCIDGVEILHIDRSGKIIDLRAISVRGRVRLRASPNINKGGRRVRPSAHSFILTPAHLHKMKAKSKFH